jgi:hypothetical protein
MAVTAAVRRLVLRRSRGRCEYCRIDSWPLTVDHIIPISSGGFWPGGQQMDLDHLDNLAAACWLCNRAKSDATSAVDPLSGETCRLFHPRRNRWHDHFAWTAGGLEVVGRTAVGRATAAHLRLNRPEYVRQRTILRAAMRGGGPAWP